MMSFYPQSALATSLTRILKCTSTNQEKIDDYAVVDLGIKYSRENFFWLKEANVRFEIKNLLDEKYVGAIYASDTETDVD